MKRKLALLLAGVMATTMLPMNLFASSANKIMTYISSTADNTVLYEPGAGLDATDLTSYVGTYGGHKEVDAVRVGTYLTITPDTATGAIVSGEAITLTLNNADWYFRNGSATTTNTTDLTFAANYLSNAGASINVSQFLLNATALASGSAVNSVVEGGSYYGNVLDQTYNPSKGNWVYNAANTSGTFLQTGFQGLYVPVSAAGAVPYIMAVRADGKTADVMFTTGVAAGTSFDIPLVVKTIDEEKDVTVSVSTSNSKVSPGVYTLISAAKGATNAFLSKIATGRSSVKLGDLTIRETRVGVIGIDAGGSFSITAPDGYKFVDTFTTDGVTLTSASVVRFGAAGLGNATASMFYSNGARLLTVNFTGGTRSSAVLADVVISGLEVTPLSSSTWGQVSNMRISDINKSGVTDQTIEVVGNRLDYGLSLTAAKSTDTVPTLITGRWISDSAMTAINSLKKDEMKVLQVKVSENAPNSWWTTRGTTFELTEGVIVRAIKVSGIENIKTTAGSPATPFLSNTTYYREQGSATTGKIAGTPVVFGDDNTFEFDGDLSVLDPTKKASVTLDVYVSISQKMDGQDITMRIGSGGGLSEPTEPVVVAHAVAPVSVTSVLTDVKLGSLPVPTSDIVIKENVVGALRYNQEVRMALTDTYGANVSDDIVFATGTETTAKVTDGDLAIKGFGIGSGSYSFASNVVGASANWMNFFIKSESLNKASTITISNVTVKANRRLPEADRAVYKLFVYGQAIANNYDVDENYGQFSDIESAGVSVDYIRVSGTETIATEQFTLSLAEGTTSYTLGTKTFDLDPSYMPYNKNGTVYVSLRLLGESLLANISSTPVHWNESNRTVVLDLQNNQKATFPVGAKYYTVAGVQFDMVDDAGNLVATEIVNDRTFVPLRQVAYALGIDKNNIKWVQDTQTVVLNPVAE